MGSKSKANLLIDEGDRLLEEGSYLEAVRAYEEAIKIDPNISEAWNNKGYALDELGKYQEAIKAYNQALKINPNNSETINNKGVALFNLGKYQEALEFYDQVIDPNDSDTYYNKGEALYKLGRYQDAFESFDKYVKIDSFDSDAWNIRGKALLKMGKYQMAVKSFNEAIEIDSKYTEALNNRKKAQELFLNKERQKLERERLEKEKLEIERQQAKQEAKNLQRKKFIEQNHFKKISFRLFSKKNEFPAFAKIKIEEFTYDFYFLGFYQAHQDNINSITKKIREYKFKKGEIRENRAIEFAYDIIDLIKEKNLKFNMIIPIPKSEANAVSEGHKVITSIVSENLGIKNGLGILNRIKTVPTSHQYGSRPIKDHIKSINCIKELTNENILLYDDIYTHGNTAAACAIILENKNINDLTLITLGKTPTKAR